MSQDRSWLPWAIWLGGALPGALLVKDALAGELGANPVETGLNACGELAIKCLILSLWCTPARILSGSSWPMAARKHLGLLAFAYACAHLFVYVGLDRLGQLGTLFKDFTERPFIVVGLAAFALLIPLALTSSKRAIKRLGGSRWGRLHKLVYLVALLAIVHFVMRAKKDATEALAHGAVLAVAFLVRIVDAVRRRKRRPQLTVSKQRGPS